MGRAIWTVGNQLIRGSLGRHDRSVQAAEQRFALGRSFGAVGLFHRAEAANLIGKFGEADGGVQSGGSEVFQHGADVGFILRDQRAFPLLRRLPVAGSMPVTSGGARWKIGCAP